MPGQVPEDEKARRLERVMRLQAQISLERNQLRVGSQERLLVTGREGAHYIARSQWEAPDSDGIIRLASENKLMPGDMVMASITAASTYDLTAQTLQNRGKANEPAK